jgi:hypothetical protein
LECYRAADGIMAATAGSGDFGTSPIFGQLSGKPLLAKYLLRWGVARKAQGGSRN